MSTTQDDKRTSADQAVSFATTVRGYERRQVDDFVARRLRVERELRAELDEVREALRLATERAESGTSENTRLREQLSGRAAPEGYGSRAEKLLRLAEAEASEMRADASRESAAVVEQARVVAEQHRHESEQAIIARSRELDQDIRRRAAELADREEKAAEQIAAGRAEAERLRSAAAEAAAKLRDETEAEAELIKARARAEAGRAHEEVRLEQNRVSELRGEVHAELNRVHRMITGQLSSGQAG